MVSTILRYVAVFFASVTTLVGAGILGLPVSLYDVSPRTFFIVFSLAFSGQLALITFTVEILHRASAEEREDVTLYNLSTLYLPNASKRLFLWTNIIIYLVLLVVFGIAGTQAVNSLFHISNTDVPLHLVMLYFMVALGVVFIFGESIKYLLIAIPYCESLAFIACVVLISRLPKYIRSFSFFGYTRSSSESLLESAINPFLMSTMTLSGLPSTVCFTYNWIRSTETSNREFKFLMVLILSLSFSAVLSVSWVLTVFEIVPRVTKSGAPSLAEAAKTGEISTIPLLEVLRLNGYSSTKLLATIEILLNFFTLVSSGASFLVISGALKDYLNGIAHSERQKTIANIGSFSFVFAIVVLYPHGFEKLIEYCITPIVCVQALLIVYMFWNMTNSGQNDYDLAPLLGPQPHTSVVGLPNWILFALKIYALPIFLSAIIAGIANPWIARGSQSSKLSLL